jgi:hypothetical protein
VSELLAVSDPELSLRIDYTRAITLIHRAQLLLDLSIAPEKTLNGLLNQLALAIQERLTTEGEPRGGALDGKIMQAQAQVIDRTKDVISHCTSKVSPGDAANRWPGHAQCSTHVYEVRPRKDKRGVDLISDALPILPIVVW